MNRSERLIETEQSCRYLVRLLELIESRVKLELETRTAELKSAEGRLTEERQLFERQKDNAEQLFAQAKQVETNLLSLRNLERECNESMEQLTLRERHLGERASQLDALALQLNNKQIYQQQIENNFAGDS